jgi:DNA-binding transcriptional regulator YiaG
MSDVSLCSCGGRLRPVTARRVDILPLFGLRGGIEGAIPVLRCGRCGGETYEPRTLDRMLLAVARAVLARPRILGRDEARFLRKSVLALTQERLARRMGINKVTVADWERGERSLSKEHDYELRGIALAALLEQSAPDRVARLMEETSQMLMAPRLEGPPRRATSYRIPFDARRAA